MSKYCFFIFMIFISGMNVCANLSKLVKINPNFHGSWTSVAMSVIFTILFAAFAYDIVKNSRR